MSPSPSVLDAVALDDAQLEAVTGGSPELGFDPRLETEPPFVIDPFQTGPIICPIIDVVGPGPELLP